MWDMKLKLIDTDNSILVTRGKRVEVLKGKGVKYTVTEDDSTVGGGNILIYTDCIL